MKKMTIATLLIIVIGTFTIGCGSSSSTSATEWNGRLVDTNVSGVSWTCGAQSGVTSQFGVFGPCNIGDDVTFSIGTIVLSTVTSQTSDNIFTIQDLLGLDRNVSANSTAQNDQANALAAVILTLDSDNDPSNGISISTNGVAALETAIINNGSITPATVVAIIADIVTLDPSLTPVTTADAALHLAQTLVEIDNGTIPSPSQPSQLVLSGNTGGTGGTP